MDRMSAHSRDLFSRITLEAEEEGETPDKTLAGHIVLIKVDSSSIPEKSEDPSISGLIEKYLKQGLTIGLFNIMRIK